jgi:molybdopterin-containing oxidoreductase family membrane subunit
MVKNKQPLFKTGILISALLTVLGIVCWTLQLTQGLQLTNLNNYNTWGLYVVGFVIFTGVGAGSLILTSSAWLFVPFKKFRPYTRISCFVGALCSVVAAGIFIVVDIGNPERAWEMLVYMNITSPLIWDTAILGSYVIVGIIYTYKLILVHQGKREEKSLKAISVIAIIAGLLVTVTALAFAVQVSRPMWNNPAQPASFLLAAVVMAVCILIIVYTALQAKGYISIKDGVLSNMGRFGAMFLAGELIIVLSEAVIGLYAGSGEEAEVIHWLITGEGASFFYVELCAIVLGSVLLLKGKKNMLVTGAVVGFFAVFLIKYNLIQSQLSNPLIQYAGPPAYSGGRGVYLPSLLEIGLSIGIVGLVVLLAIIGLNLLNLGDNRVQSGQ